MYRSTIVLFSLLLICQSQSSSVHAKGCAFLAGKFKRRTVLTEADRSDFLNGMVGPFSRTKEKRFFEEPNWQEKAVEQSGQFVDRVVRYELKDGSVGEGIFKSASVRGGKVVLVNVEAVENQIVKIKNISRLFVLSGEYTAAEFQSRAKSFEVFNGAEWNNLTPKVEENVVRSSISGNREPAFVVESMRDLHLLVYKFRDLNPRLTVEKIIERNNIDVSQVGEIKFQVEAATILPSAAQVTLKSKQANCLAAVISLATGRSMENRNRDLETHEFQEALQRSRRHALSYSGKDIGFEGVPLENGFLLPAAKAVQRDRMTLVTGDAIYIYAQRDYHGLYVIAPKVVDGKITDYYVISKPGERPGEVTTLTSELEYYSRDQNNNPPRDGADSYIYKIEVWRSHVEFLTH